MRVAIVYYSLTGNTAYVAKRIGEGILAEEPDWEVDIRNIMDIEDVDAFYSDYDLIGFGALTWSWRTPKKMTSHLDSIKSATLKDKQCFFFATCGGTVGDTAALMYRHIKSKGIKTLAQLAVQCPGNYAPLSPNTQKAWIFGGEESQQALDFGKSLPKLSKEGKKISIWSKKGTGWVSWMMADKACKTWTGKITIDQDSCVKCGKCVKGCDYGALTREKDDEGKWKSPDWNKSACVGCTKCINICPVAAISAARAKNKAQYRFTEKIVLPGTTRTVSLEKFEELAGYKYPLAPKAKKEKPQGEPEVAEKEPEAEEKKVETITTVTEQKEEVEEKPEPAVEPEVAEEVNEEVEAKPEEEEVKAEVEEQKKED